MLHSKILSNHGQTCPHVPCTMHIPLDTSAWYQPYMGIWSCPPQPEPHGMFFLGEIVSLCGIRIKQCCIPKYCPIMVKLAHMFIAPCTHLWIQVLGINLIWKSSHCHFNAKNTASRDSAKQNLYRAGSFLPAQKHAHRPVWTRAVHGLPNCSQHQSSASQCL